MTREPLLHWPGWRQLGYALAWGLAQAGWFAIVYGGANWITAQHLFRIRLHFEIEREMPLVAPLVIAYLSLNPLMWLAPFVLRTRCELRAFALSLAAATAIAGIGFLILPAEQIFAPTESRHHGIWEGWFWLCGQLALEHNYFPSLHVAFATMCVQSYMERANRRARAALFAWWTAIAISTLLIHQHYVLDVVAGLALGWAAISLVYRPLREPVDRLPEQTIATSRSNDRGLPT